MTARANASQVFATTPDRISLQRWLRAAVQRRFEALARGSLRVRDPWGEWRVGGVGSPEASLHVQDPSFYRDIIIGGSLGAARSYIQAKWSSDDLTRLFRFLVLNSAQADRLDGGVACAAAWLARLRHGLRANTRSGSRHNIHAHYNLGNELFALFLDKTMTYSAGIFEARDSTLEEASIAKIDRICRKLELREQDHVLEIGSGWGSFALYAASRYGCRVTTATISREQFELARSKIRSAGLGGKIDIRLCDYRDLKGRYDKLVSIEMIEAVGHKYLSVYFRKCAELLKDDGRMVLQSITMSDQRYRQYLCATDFIQAYIFPGSCVPSLTAMLNAITAASDFKLTHLEDIGPHYAVTLRRWLQRFKANENQVLRLGYPPEFIRLWEYYLCYCEAGFLERYLGDVQMILDKAGRRSAPLLPPLPISTDSQTE